MKRTAFLLSTILLLAMACHRDSATVETAAMKLYEQYANNKQGVTVAYIGDYNAYGQVFNAVMFRADDSIQWAWLKEEFGVIVPDDLDPAVKARDGVTMLSIHIDTSLTFKSKEDEQAYIDSIVRQVVTETLGSLDFHDTSVFVGTVQAADTNLPSNLRSMLSRQRQFDQKRDGSGSAEYIISVDLENRTLLCFFCNSTEDSKLLVKWLNKGIDK